MSSIVENVIVEEVVVVVEKKPKAKSFAQKDKKTLFSIMGFLLNLKEQGILDDEKVMECLEALPLYKTAAEKTAFFQLDMFDTKKVEEELYKPMLSDYKKAKKEKRTKKEKKQVSADGEKKKPRAKKAKVIVEEEKPVAEPVAEPVADVEEKPVVKEKKPRAKKEVVEGGEPKRGRKPKQQVVELAQDVSTNSVEEESLDVLIQSMNVKETAVEEIQVEDIDDMMRELEAEEIKEVEVVAANKPIKEKKKSQKVKKTDVVVENK